jgi:hypothetical protein
LQRIKQGVVEAETIGRLPTLRGEVEMAFTVGFRGTEHPDAILGTVRYGHVWDWSTGRVEDNAFDSLSKLGLFDNYEFSNRLCRATKNAHVSAITITRRTKRLLVSAVLEARK